MYRKLKCHTLADIFFFPGLSHAVAERIGSADVHRTIESRLSTSNRYESLNFVQQQQQQIASLEGHRGTRVGVSDLPPAVDIADVGGQMIFSSSSFSKRKLNCAAITSSSKRDTSRTQLQTNDVKTTKWKYIDSEQFIRHQTANIDSHQQQTSGDNNNMEMTTG
jgi:hypothetical protein